MGDKSFRIRKHSAGAGAMGVVLLWGVGKEKKQL